MNHYTLTWKSTVKHRYFSEMLLKAENLLKQLDVLVLNSFGSAPLVHADTDTELCADNGFEVLVPNFNTAQNIADWLAQVVGYPVTVTEIEERSS